MTPPPSALVGFPDGSLGGASRSASFIQAPHAGLDGIGGRTGDAVHNFSNQLPDGGRLVFVGIDAGYSAPFVFLSIHSGDL